ncbi:MAG: glycosyltransferase family 2 protein [Candidatus Magnetoovum sp. WYHC-5]|nr:glycosyltransferase family 2 protein [Candidatus Magnetoovum sp. WYHC-5]
MEKLISFVIPNWNHKVLLGECLSSILSSKGALNKQVIVVDNASSDGSYAYVKQIFGNRVEWIQNKKNEGYARAVNKGVALASGELIFLLNNDVKLYTDTVRNLVLYLEGRSQAGAVSPLLYYPNGELQISCRRFPTPSALLLQQFNIGRCGPYKKWKLTPMEHLSGSRVVMQPMASALLIRRHCWFQVGPMDESFPIFFNDVDWCYRLYTATNYKIYLCTWARAMHHEGASVNRLGFRKKIEFYKGLYRFYRKHYIGKKVRSGLKGV